MIANQEMRNIIDKKEQDSAQNASLCRQAGADTCADDTEGSPEEESPIPASGPIRAAFTALMASSSHSSPESFAFLNFSSMAIAAAGDEGYNGRCGIEDSQMSL